MTAGERDIASDYSALAESVDRLVAAYRSPAAGPAGRAINEQALFAAIEDVAALRHQQEDDMQDCRVITARILVPASAPVAWYTDGLNEHLRQHRDDLTAAVIDWSYEVHRLEVPRDYEEGDFLPLIPNGVKEELR